MKPTWTRRLPYFTSASTMRRQPAAVVASGFSQKTGFPAAMEASTNSSWVGPQEVTTTTSTSGAAMTSRPVGRARAPIAAATSLARPPSMSVTATTLAPPIRWLIRCACSTPIAPVPMTPTLYPMASLLGPPRSADEVFYARPEGLLELGHGQGADPGGEGFVRDRRLASGLQERGHLPPAVQDVGGVHQDPIVVLDGRLRLAGHHARHVDHGRLAREELGLPAQVVVEGVVQEREGLRVGAPRDAVQGCSLGAKGAALESERLDQADHTGLGEERAVSVQRRDQIVGALGRGAWVADLVEGAHDDVRAAHLPGLRDEPLQLLQIGPQVLAVLEGIEGVDGDDPDAGLGQDLLQLCFGETVQDALLGEVVPHLGHLHPEVGGELQELGKGQLRVGDAVQRKPFTRVHVVLLRRNASRLSIAAVLALVEDHGADDDPAFDDRLPVRRDVDEVESVVEHADDQRAHDGAGDGADAAGGERGPTDHRRGDSVELVAHSQTRLARADARGDDQAGQSGEHAGVGVDEDLVATYVDAGDPGRLLVAADGVDVFSELGPGVEDVRHEGHDDQDQDRDRHAEEVPR